MSHNNKKSLKYVVKHIYLFFHPKITFIFVTLFAVATTLCRNTNYRCQFTKVKDVW